MSVAFLTISAAAAWASTATLKLTNYTESTFMNSEHGTCQFIVIVKKGKQQQEILWTGQICHFPAQNLHCGQIRSHASLADKAI